MTNAQMLASCDSSRYAVKRVSRESNVTEMRVEVMFWVLFARDNMYKPQSEVPSTVAAAKIEQTLKSAGLNLIQELTQLAPVCGAPQNVHSERHHKITFRLTCTVKQ